MTARTGLQWLELKEEPIEFHALRKPYHKYIYTETDRLDKLCADFQMADDSMNQM